MYLVTPSKVILQSKCCDRAFSTYSLRFVNSSLENDGNTENPFLLASVLSKRFWSPNKTALEDTSSWIHTLYMQLTLAVDEIFQATCLRN